MDNPRASGEDLILMSMTARERANFRQTKAWRNFREDLRNERRKDPITGARLVKGYELHHMDLDPENYRDLNPDNFCCLNPQTHETIHFLYNIYRKDPDVIDRVKSLLDRMNALNT